MKLGCMVHLEGRLAQVSLEEQFARLKEFGIPTCQLNCWKPELFTDEKAEEIKTLSAKYGIEISALWCGWSGPCTWNFYDGQTSLGLVPVAYRYQRMQELMKGALFAEKIGVTDVITHCGYLPENPVSAEYAEIITALKSVVKFYREHGRWFLFETGQETPVTLLRVITDLGIENLGVNLDPANLVMVAGDRPENALKYLGKYVVHTHAKDGIMLKKRVEAAVAIGEEAKEHKAMLEMGRKYLELPLGDGDVDFDIYLPALAATGFNGFLTIEREVGDQPEKDIAMAVQFLREKIAKYNLK